MTLRAVESTPCGAEIPPQIYDSSNNERSQPGFDDCHRGSLAEGFEKHLTDKNVTEKVHREGGYSAGPGCDFPKFIPAKTDSRNPDKHFEQSETSRDGPIAAASESIHGRISLGRKPLVGSLRDELDTPLHQDLTHAQHMAAGQCEHMQQASHTTVSQAPPSIVHDHEQRCEVPESLAYLIPTTLRQQRGDESQQKHACYLKEDAVHPCREVTVNEYSSTFIDTSTTCHEQSVDQEAIVQVDDMGEQGLPARKFLQETKPNQPSMEGLTGTRIRQKQGTIVRKRTGGAPEDAHAKDQAGPSNLTRSKQKTWTASNFKVWLSDWRKAWEEQPGVRKTLQRWKELRSKVMTVL
jgi:hypothetical protein